MTETQYLAEQLDATNSALARTLSLIGGERAMTILASWIKDTEEIMSTYNESNRLIEELNERNRKKSR